MALDPGEIYYGVDGARQGPVDIDALRTRLHAGSVSRDDFVWDEDLDEWVPIANYPAFQSDDPIELGDPALTAAGFERAPSFDYAGVPWRFAAWLLDSVLLMLPITIWEMTVESLLGVNVEELPMLDMFRPPDPQTLEFLIWVNVGSLVIRALYWTLLESSPWQATVGKKLLGLVVVDETGRRATRQRAFVRFVGRFFCEITLLIGYLLILFDERRQGLHDRIARTFVVRT